MNGNLFRSSFLLLSFCQPVTCRTCRYTIEYRKSRALYIVIYFHVSLATRLRQAHETTAKLEQPLATSRAQSTSLCKSAISRFQHVYITESRQRERKRTNLLSGGGPDQHRKLDIFYRFQLRVVKVSKVHHVAVAQIRLILSCVHQDIAQSSRRRCVEMDLTLRENTALYNSFLEIFREDENFHRKVGDAIHFIADKSSPSQISFK